MSRLVVVRDDLSTEELFRATRRFRIAVVSVLVIGLGGFWAWAAWHSGQHASQKAGSTSEESRAGFRERARHDHLGVAAQPVTPLIARAFGLDDARGALVGDVAPESPADRAGIQRGDVILDLDEWPVEDSSDLRHRVAKIEPGGSVEVVVVRDGHAHTFTVELDDAPPEIYEAGVWAGEGGGTRGISVETVTARRARELRLPPGRRAVVVTAVEPGTAWSEAGLGRGDVIEEVGRREVADQAEFDRALERAGDEPILLLVNHGGTTTFVVVDLG